MYHPPSKRKQLIQRVSIYSLMSLAVLCLVAILAFFMLGYQFNKSDGKLEQGGLVQFDSQPTGATVAIDGKNFGTRTTSKTTMSAGQHFVTMQRAGYKTWQKSVDVLPGAVLWLNYTRLIPKTLTPESVATMPVMTSNATSKDGKWMVIQGEPTEPALHLIDLGQDPVKQTKLTLPEDSFTLPAEGKTHSFSVQTWDPDNRYVLVKHVYNDDQLEWLVVDTDNPSATKNVTTLLGVDASSVVFSNENSRTVYLLTNGEIRRANLNEATLSGPLVSGVAEFSLYKQTIVFTTTLDEATKMRMVGYLDEGASKPRTLRTYSDNAEVPLHVAVSKYFENNYVAIAYGETVDVLKGRLPKSDSEVISSLENVTTLTIPGGATHLSIRTDGRFVVAQTPSSFVTYDIELKKQTATNLKGAATTPQSAELKWIDGYTLWSDIDGTLRLYEFDGANQQAIMPVAPGFAATLSPNDRFLYGIHRSEDGTYHVQRVKMIL